MEVDVQLCEIFGEYLVLWCVWSLWLFMYSGHFKCSIFVLHAVEKSVSDNKPHCKLL